MTTGTVPQHPQQPQIVYATPATSTGVRENYAALTSRTFGIIQICGGILAVIFQAVLIGLVSSGGYSGAGIWCGILYILAGTFGHCAGKYKTTCWIVTYMVMSIVASAFSIGIVASSSIGITQDYINRWHRKFEENYVYSSYAFNGLLLLIMLVEVVTLIWGSALTCKACCCTTAQNGAVIPVQYINGQPVVYVSPGHTQQMTTMQAQGPPAVQQPQQPPQYGQMRGMQPQMMTYSNMGSSAPPTEQKQNPPDSPPPSYQ